MTYSKFKSNEMEKALSELGLKNRDTMSGTLKPVKSITMIMAFSSMCSETISISAMW